MFGGEFIVQATERRFEPFVFVTVVTVRLAQRAVTGNLLSQVMFADHTDLPPAAALQMKDLFRLNHLHNSGMSRESESESGCSCKQAV